MKKSVIGLCAHVDAGKTTLAEALLYHTGMISSMGRVDNKNAFLDTTGIEKERGITVFSHQAVIKNDKYYFTLLDTPGHSDFLVQAEQCFRVLDCAILLISASDGVQSHTRTLWRMLREYDIPVFIFVNKTDIMYREREEIFGSLCAELSPKIADFSGDIYESAAMTDEGLLELYLDGKLDDPAVEERIKKRELFPLYWGSALKGEGIDGFVDILERFAVPCPEREDLGARVFKITSENGKRLTHFKVTGGSISVKDTLNGEKINNLYVYSGAGSKQVNSVCCGEVAAAVGLTVGRDAVFGFEKEDSTQKIVPVMRFSVTSDCDPHTLADRLKALEIRIPTLDTQFSGEVTVSVMGDMELEILSELYRNAFGAELSFGTPRIRYMETISGETVGVGHYEPLRHYAEVVVKITEAPAGSGIIYGSECPEDVLSSSRQRAVLSALESKLHKGVLTGSPLTDVSITLMNGRMHIKHTVGGDFFRAGSRAVRQGLMKANNVLLEPYYDFRLSLPGENLGRALTDLDNMGAVCEAPEIGSTAVIAGYAPVSRLIHYKTEVKAYTKGEGELDYVFRGYLPAKDPESIIEGIGYDPLADLENTPDSVFCSHGAAVSVRWDTVEEHMHTSIGKEASEEQEQVITPSQIARFRTRLYSDEELMEVFERTYGKIQRPERQAMRREKDVTRSSKPHPAPDGPDYLLVDGYNIIFAWDELKELAKTSLDHARKRLEDILANFAGFRECEVILVFDAYKVKGQTRETEKRGRVSTVFTKEAETADMYIERTTREIKKARRIRVATSDYAEQLIILGNGALRVSANEFLEEVRSVERAISKLIEEMK